MADKYSEDLELECSCGINIVWKIIDLETTMKLPLWMLIIKLSLAFELFVKKINKVAYMIKSYLLWLPFFFICHCWSLLCVTLLVYPKQASDSMSFFTLIRALAMLTSHVTSALFSFCLYLFISYVSVSPLSSPLQKGLLLLLLLSVSGFSSIAHHHFHCVSKHCSESISVA